MPHDVQVHVLLLLVYITSNSWHQSVNFAVWFTPKFHIFKYGLMTYLKGRGLLARLFRKVQKILDDPGHMAATCQMRLTENL